MTAGSIQRTTTRRSTFTVAIRRHTTLYNGDRKSRARRNSRNMRDCNRTTRDDIARVTNACSSHDPSGRDGAQQTVRRTLELIARQPPANRS